MSVDIQIAVLGIVGTLSGTVLGWLLNSLSQKGKINVFVKKCEETYMKTERTGGLVECNFEEAEYYQYNLSVDVYNSSRETRIMRDICIAFMDKKELCFTSIPQDDSTERSGHHRVYYEDISVVNIPAKSVAAIDLHGGLNSGNDEWKHLSNSNRIMIMYSDEKNKRKKVEIYKRG